LTDTENCNRAVTRGVEVIASSIYVPEMRMHIFSIRIRLLAPDDSDEYMSPEQRGFETCQIPKVSFSYQSCIQAESNSMYYTRTIPAGGAMYLIPVRARYL